MNDKPAPTPLALQPDEINRLWQHGMHEERLFHDRLNFFSAIQVGLLGVFAILYHKETEFWVFVPLTISALAFALLWLRVQVRHWHYCVHVNERIKVVVCEYAQTVAAFASPGRKDGLSISRPLAIAVPLLFAATWVALFAWVLVRATSLLRNVFLASEARSQVARRVARLTEACSADYWKVRRLGDGRACRTRPGIRRAFLSEGIDKLTTTY